MPWLNQLRDEAGPTGLMRRADAASVVAMEIFVKQEVIAKMGIACELRMIVEHRPLPAGVLQEQSAQSAA